MQDTVKQKPETRSHLRSSPQIIRVVRWFEKNGDAQVGEETVANMELDRLQALFEIPASNPMYDCYAIATLEQTEYLDRHLQNAIDPQQYDYFLECDAAT